MEYIAGNRYVLPSAVTKKTKYYAFTHKGWTYIVMQRVRGECLAYSWKSRSAESQTRILQQLKSK